MKQCLRCIQPFAIGQLPLRQINIIHDLFSAQWSKRRRLYSIQFLLDKYKNPFFRFFREFFSTSNNFGKCTHNITS